MCPISGQCIAVPSSSRVLLSRITFLLVALCRPAETVSFHGDELPSTLATNCSGSEYCLNASMPSIWWYLQCMS